jgi:hypothetical protein
MFLRREIQESNKKACENEANDVLTSDLMKEHVQKKNEKLHPLIGTWFNADEYETDVEYIVSATRKWFAVRAVDRYDGEEGEVSEVKWDGDVLSFAVHWNSTGRFIKARLLAISPNRVEYTYTFTQQEMWHRKEPHQLGKGVARKAEK